MYLIWIFSVIEKWETHVQFKFGESLDNLSSESHIQIVSFIELIILLWLFLHVSLVRKLICWLSK